MKFIYNRNDDTFLLVPEKTNMVYGYTKIDPESMQMMLDYRASLKAPRSEYDGYTGPIGEDLT